MGKSDAVRDYCGRHIIEPARARGATEVSIRARDVHDALGFDQRFPLVCSALRSQKFAEAYRLHLKLMQRPDPSCTTVFTFALGPSATAPMTPQRKLVHFQFVSLDGYMEGPNAAIDWHLPDEELHEFANALQRESGAYVYGRRTYEVMSYWDTADQNPDFPSYVLDFARTYQDRPKYVVSQTLDQVGPNATLIRDDPILAITQLKQQPGGPLHLGGVSLAASLMPHGLIDEFGLFVHPIVLGGGTPMFPELAHRIPLRLLETRTFASGVVYVRYQVAGAVGDAGA